MRIKQVTEFLVVIMDGQYSIEAFMAISANGSRLGYHRSVKLQRAYFKFLLPEVQCCFGNRSLSLK